MSTLASEKNRTSVCSTTSEHEISHMINSSTPSGQPSPPSSSNIAAPPRTNNAPADNRRASPSVVLETLLVDGQRKTWRFDPQSSIATVRQHIWSHWPQEWPQPRPQSDSLLRVLHLGHILDNPSLTLASRGMRLGTTTVVHLIIRSGSSSEPPKAPQPPPVKKSSSHPGAEQQQNERTPGCSCVIC